MNNRETGKNKEKLAEEYLKKQGYFIISKNYRVRQGEIDIVAREREQIIFVEVKYRSKASCGNPLEAVGIKKQKQISRVALFYLYQNKISIDNTPIRFDVIGILGDEIVHIKNAFDYIG